MKTYGGVAPPFLALALDRGEWSDSRPGRFILGENVAGAHWIGGWMDPGFGLDAVEERKIPFFLSGIEPKQYNRSLYRLSYPSC
jgi:hypothetical protein